MSNIVIHPAAFKPLGAVLQVNHPKGRCRVSTVRIGGNLFTKVESGGHDDPAGDFALLPGNLDNEEACTEYHARMAACAEPVL